MLVRFAAAFLTVIAAPAALAQKPIPENARAMLDAAAATGETLQIDAVANAARAVFPDAVDQIDIYAAYLRDRVVNEKLGLTSDLVVVSAPPAKPKVAPTVEDEVEEQELPPGKAPEWLKLGPWNGKATASGVVATGNSRNAAAGIAIDANREFSYFTHNVKLYFDYGKSKGNKNQQRWGAAYKLDYLLGDKSYAYGRIAYDEDEFSGFDYKLFGGLGFGHRFYDDKRFKLKVEGGPGYQYAPIDDDRTVDSRLALYTSLELDWIIRDGLKLDQDINTTWTDPSSTLLSKTALTVALTDTLSTGVSFLYRYETNPPGARLNTDTTFRMNLTYGF